MKFKEISTRTFLIVCGLLLIVSMLFLYEKVNRVSQIFCFINMLIGLFLIIGGLCLPYEERR
jgi:hypothetical protein